MIYVMSDLHGCYEPYKKMLELIQFSKNDMLYILGDITDRGNEGIRILQDMMNYPNIVPILGNHDYMMYEVCSMESDIDRNKNVERINTTLMALRFAWISDGGKPTLEQFKKLSYDQQKVILEYLKEFRLYDQVTVNGKKYLLIHAGVNKTTDLSRPETITLDEAIATRLDYDTVYHPSVILVSGHTPTVAIDPLMKGQIIIQNNHIAVDCGCVFHMGLGCICLDTMQTFYVR
ncbi:MAG: fructose-bisphosphatase class III [Erysipelotrichaceae bacterium]|nr:fructose-bisphosphatase class III [Erysipelotrichaceae bacterium]